MPMRHVLAVLVPLLCVACGSDTPTSPTTSTSATTSVAPATIDESYNSTLPIAGSKFYSFPVVQNGTVNIALASLTGPGITEDMSPPAEAMEIPRRELGKFEEKSRNCVRSRAEL